MKTTGMNCAVIASALAMFATGAPAFEIDLRKAGIEVSPSCATNESQRLAAKELEKHLALIAGGRAPAAAACSAFVIGKAPPGGAAAKAHESHAHAVGGKVYFWGDDSNGRYGTLYGVYGFLEKKLGVKWVEPGDRGIVFAKRRMVEAEEGWSYRFYPPFVMSILRTYNGSAGAWLNPKYHDYTPVALRIDEARAKALGAERVEWVRRMRHQSRRRFSYGHAFEKWNERFAETRPELLAMDKNGKRGYPGERGRDSRNARYLKLCVSNPAVADQIIADWCNAGTNEYLNVCPNDAHGYCLCDKCRSWDADLPGEDFNTHKTDRYVKFWNIVAEKARAIRPDVKLITYFYAAYRMPPRREKLLYPENVLAGIVPTTAEDSAEMVGGWYKMGLRHYFVRPNYLCSSVAVMRGYERYFCEEFKQHVALGMIGADEDNTPRATTQFETYVIARLIAEPDLTFDEIEAEFLSQYGSAAPEMKECFVRIRERGEMGRAESVARAKKKIAADVFGAVDESNLYITGYSSHTESDFDGDLEVVGRALAHNDLSEIERWRVNRVRAIIENAKLTRRFILSRDKMKLPEFAELGRKLILKRIELKDAIDDNWGRVFRGFPAEVRWWMPIKDKYLREFWEPSAPAK